MTTPVLPTPVFPALSNAPIGPPAVSSLGLHRVATPGDLRRFIELPRRLYRADPHYVAPLDHDRRQLLDPRRSAFLAHGEAAYWIVMRGTRPVGRISAQIDTLAAPDIGSFGCLDAEDDGEAVAALLDAARNWLAGRGRQKVVGPYNLSINAETGLLLEGFSAPPMLLMPWHPPYLRDLVERCGFRLAKTLDSYTLDLCDPGLAHRLSHLGVERRRRDFSVRGLDPRGLLADAERGRLLYNAAWAGNWGSVPVSEAEMAGLLASVHLILRPEYGVMVERAGALVGFALFLPNLFDVTGRGGAPGPIGWAAIGWRVLRRRFSSGRVLLFGVEAGLVGTPAGSSVALLLIDELVRRAGRTGLTSVECGWILEDNYAMSSVIRWLGATRTRRLGLFEADLAPARPGDRP